MERRLARGADKCIHAVPGLLEAVSGAGLDALLSTRPRGDVEVDLVRICRGRVPLEVHGFHREGGVPRQRPGHTQLQRKMKPAYNC